MADNRREALITGIGIVSCLGEGAEAHWQALSSAQPRADTTTFAPYVVHPIAPLDYDRQIPKKGDQRQMEPWQRIGTYAAGLALESASAKGNADLLAKMDMIVAAGGGERDLSVDSAILSGRQKAPSPDSFLNERLMNDLRPTLFLAQLSNLLAGNISIVHGVTGSSRTFMGEEASGIDAVRIAVSRINAGQSDIVLVGGAHNGERRDLLMLYEFGRCNLKDKFAPVWERGPGGGFALGSIGRLSGPGIARPCASARRKRPGAAVIGRFRPLEAPAGDRRLGASAAVGRRGTASAAGAFCRAFRGKRRGARHRRGAQFPRRPDQGSHSCHRYLSWSCNGAAISHEYRARRGGSQPW